MNESYWADLVRRILREAGGERILITGAKLKQSILAASDNKNALDSYLEAAGLRFRTFLEGIDGVSVKKRVGTDMLVGLEGARWPTVSPTRAPSLPEFRQDVYEALTRVSQARYHYFPSTDEFRPSSGELDDTIAMPSVTLEELVAQRREFAESVEDSSVRQELLVSLDGSLNPLANFQRELNLRGLVEKWHRFKFDILFAKLSEWASANNIAVSPAWHNIAIEHRRDTPQQILTRLVQYMSEPEIRNLNVPFRAVEAFYRDLTK